MYLKVVGYRGDLLPNWARNNSLDVPSEAEFQAGSTALINHWNHDPEILSLGTDVGEFTKSQINAVFNPNQFYPLLSAYKAAVQSNPNMADLFDKALHCQKLVDIYQATGTAMREINQKMTVRSLRDCSDFRLLKAIHWATADKIGLLFPGSGGISASDRGHQVMQNTHLTGLGDHGFRLDHRRDITRNLIYLMDDNLSAAFRISIEGGKLKWAPDASNLNAKVDLHTLDWVNTGKRDLDDNTAHSPKSHGKNKGVAGFCMTLNHQLFAKKHHLVRSKERTNKGIFYHSSYVAGNDILCTGCIMVDHGTLIAIDNLSGHYQPTTEKLVLAIRRLESQGVDVSQLDVYARAINQWKKAPELLNDRDILSNIYNRPVPLHKASAIAAAIQSYSSRWKTSFAGSGESDAAIKNMKQRDGAGLVEMAMFYAYKSSTNTPEEEQFLSGLARKYGHKEKVHNPMFSLSDEVDFFVPLKDKSELRTRLQKVLGPNLQAAWAS
ncbi:MAG: hypothetical protein NT172_14940 [Planctomycetota bacterium]|nr:hypothetical protein [Planctomycetota bacterium]